MDSPFFLLLTFIGSAVIGYLISLYYKKKPVNIEKVRVNLAYLGVSFTTVLGTLCTLHIVEDHIDLINSWYSASPSTIVHEAALFLFAAPMVALFSIYRRKEEEPEK